MRATGRLSLSHTLLLLLHRPAHTARRREGGAIHAGGHGPRPPRVATGSSRDHLLRRGVYQTRHSSAATAAQCRDAVLSVTAATPSSSSSSSCDALLVGASGGVLGAVPPAPVRSADTATAMLRVAIAARDAHAVLALTAWMLSRAAAAVEDMAAAAVASGDTEDMVSMLCACVAVHLTECAGSSPSSSLSSSASAAASYGLPPWVTDRFEPPAPSPAVMERPPSGNSNSNNSSSGSNVSSSPQRCPPLHAASMSTFSSLTRALRSARRRVSRSTAGRSAAADDDLRMLQLLCAVSIAPTETEALALAEEVLCRGGGAVRGALGCALAAFVQRHASLEEETAEALWLRLWASLPPTGVEAAFSSLSSSYWTSMEAVRRAEGRCTGWHLHCLLCTRRHVEAELALLTTAVSRPDVLRCLPEAAVASLLIALPPTTATTVTSESQSTPNPQQRRRAPAADVYQQLAGRLLRALPPPTSAAAAARLLFRQRQRLPAATQHAVLYARLLGIVTENYAAAAAVGGGQRRAALDALLRLLYAANVDALAASLVPSGLPSAAVMVATRSEERQRKAALLAAALRRSVEALCASSSAPSPSPSSGLQEDIDVALRISAALLQSLLSLCASRELALPARAAEPRWRRELRAKTAVRSHKYQLLLSELPHSDLSATLGRLLGDGHVEEGGGLGAALVREEQVDLRYYSLYTLGALYHAISSVDAAASAPPAPQAQSPAFAAATFVPRTTTTDNTTTQGVLDGRASAVATTDVRLRLRQLYHRRQQIFGVDDDDDGAASWPAQRPPVVVMDPLADAAGDGDAVGQGQEQEQQLQLCRSATAVTASSSPAEALLQAASGDGAQIGALRLAQCLVGRSAVAPGGRVVMDISRHPFDTWVAKGSVVVRV